MYTYKSFEIDGDFTLLRPILVTFILMAFVLFITIILSKKNLKYINGVTVISLSILSIIVSAQVVVYAAIITDELGLGGDVVSFYMLLGIAALGLLNPLIYLKKRSG